MLVQTIRFSLLLAVLAIFGSCTSTSKSTSTSTYYIVRHAEKANRTSDTPLSAEGQARAEALRDTLISKNIGQIFVTDYLRTQQTAEPLATKLGIRSTEVFANETTKLVQQLNAIKGGNTLIVGHSNTVPAIIDELMESAQNVMISETNFDNLFKVQVTKNDDEIIRDFIQLTYGVPTR